eukprot:jgi/Chlat1/1185/Chrsp114S01646
MAFMPRLRMLDLGTTDWDGTLHAPNRVRRELVYLEWRRPRYSALSAFLCNAAACQNLVVLIVEEAVHNDASMTVAESIGNLQALQVLVLRDSYQVNELPEALGGLTMLRVLDLFRTGLRMLPKSVGGLINLQKLDLSISLNLTALPESFGNLAALQMLDLSKCNSLAALPKSFGKLAALQTLDLSKCNSLAALPESFDNLAALQTLDMSNCKSLATLPESFGKLAALQTLDLSYCGSLMALPESFSKLDNLETLNLSACDYLAVLPESFSKLAALRELDLSWCASLVALPKSFGKLTALHILKLYGCFHLKALPEDFSALHPAVVAVLQQHQQEAKAKAAAAVNNAATAVLQQHQQDAEAKAEASVNNAATAGQGKETKLTVFISYCHFDKLHAKRVWRLAEQLQQDNVHVIIDDKTGYQSWPAFIGQMFKDGTKVVVVCDEYYERFSLRQPTAADWVGAGTHDEYGNILCKEPWAGYDTLVRHLGSVPAFMPMSHSALQPRRVVESRIAAQRSHETKFANMWRNEVQDAMDTIQAFMLTSADCYADFRAYRGSGSDGSPQAERLWRVDRARRVTRDFWRIAYKWYMDGMLPAYFFSESSDWLVRGNTMRLMVEPIDIANYYRLELWKQWPIGNRHYLEAENRPEYYTFLELQYEKHNKTAAPSSTQRALDEMNAIEGNS